VPVQMDLMDKLAFERSQPEIVQAAEAVPVI
jgi:hypothetical protein